MYLYNLTLSKPTGIQCAVYGNFSASKAQEIIVSRGRVLELLRPNENGKLQIISSTDVFGVIRSMATVRLTGAPIDHIVIGSDSGRIVLIKYNKDKNCFQKVHQETFGKSGCRRIVPGQYLGVDPKGRAFMIGAVEKQKFVYVLNRDQAANLTISSPLEAHKSHHICFHLVGMDNGFDNPMFAAIELDYSEADQDPTGEAAAEAEKHLTIYEMDLGLNNVVRKWSEPIDNGANLLIPVPGGGDGPGGVLVCVENFVIYRHPDHPEVRAVIPRRNDLPADRGVLIVNYTMHKKKSYFFFLIQSEYGDIYKVTLQSPDGSSTISEGAVEVRVKYFDSLPPCVSLCVLKTGFLFAAAEYGNHALYQFIGTGDEDDEDVEASSATLEQTEEGFRPIFFDPRPLRNLVLVDELPSLMPITDMKVANLLNEESPQIYALTGRGARSSLTVLRPGLSVAELAVSPLPGTPQAVWTLRSSSPDDPYDAYIVVGFSNATLVFSIGAEIRECSDSGLLGAAGTLCCQRLADGSLLQVHSQGLRHVRPDRRVNEWKAPGRRAIRAAATNETQVAIALVGGELTYFELDTATGLLQEAERRELGEEVIALDVAPAPSGRARCPFLAVGTADQAVRILSLDPGSQLLKPVAVQKLMALPESLLLLYEGGVGGSEGALDAATAGVDAAKGADGGNSVVGTAAGGAGALNLYLHIGLSNGILLRTAVDRVSGALSDSRARAVGTQAPRLLPARVRGARALLALSSRAWLGHADSAQQGRFSLAPLCYERLDWAAPFASDQCPEGIVALCRGTLRVLAIENAGEAFSSRSCRLRYTPRRLLVHPQHRVLVVAEADHQALPMADNPALLSKIRAKATAAASGGADGGDAAMMGGEGADGEHQPSVSTAALEGVEFDEELAAAEEQFGPARGMPGQWASCLRIVDPATLATAFVQELDNNEAVVSLCLAELALPGAGGSTGGSSAGSGSSGSGSAKTEVFLVVGCVKGLRYTPLDYDGCFLRIYRVLSGGRRLELLHKTPVEGGVPRALCAFKGRLLAGAGGILRLYELGKKKLLRKCEYRNLPQQIVSIHAMGSRIYVADSQESLHFFRYRKAENRLHVFADDSSPRYITASLPLDYDTVAGADKFGNIFVSRLPAEISAQVEEDPTGGRHAVAAGRLNGAPHKLETAISFHVGEVVTTLQRASLEPGGPELILYGTSMGAVGALLPFSSRPEFDFFSHLEMHLRQEAPPLCGREHLAYRSAFFPVKDVVDGDLCAQFAALPPRKQAAIAADLDRTPAEVVKKLEEIKNRMI